MHNSFCVLYISAPFKYIMKDKEENEIQINSELLDKDYDNLDYNQEEFNDEGIDEGFASQIGY